MFLAVTLAALCVASNAAAAATAPLPQKVHYDLEDADNLYKNYVKEFNKQYEAEEYGARFEIFKTTLKEINEQNALFPQTVFGPTIFADLTAEEKNSYRGFKHDSNNTEVVTPELTPGWIAEAQLDWRDKGVVTPVKNQGLCGSCYIFSAIANIEGQYAIKHGQCSPFSEQQSLDCVAKGGCGGGYPHEVMTGLVADAAGVMLESDYPYTANKGQCVEDANKKQATVLTGQQVAADDEETLANILSQTGPLSIGVSATDFQYYQGGILHPQNCDQQADHAVLLVGYGEEAGTPFWIIKNSWGASWGEQGYIRVVRGVKACAITTYVASSTVA